MIPLDMKLFEGTKFVMPDENAIALLDSGERVRLFALAEAVAKSEAAEAKCGELEQSIKTIIDQMNEIKSYLAEHFPPPTFAELWRASKRI